MKKVKIEDAIGMTLCHDVTAIRKGFKGPLFKRGHVIEEKDISELKSIGKKSIYIWEEEAGEIHEEDASLRMASANDVLNAHYKGPSEGKMDLIADEDCMLRVNVDLLRALNGIQDVTVTSLPDHYPVKKGNKVASMRIVPLVTKEENIAEFERLCKEADEKLFALLPYKEMKAGVIITGSEVYSGLIDDLFEPVARKKLGQYPCEILGVTFCDDDVSMIVSAIKDFAARGADLVVLSGGMSVDPDDVTPTAVRAAGADVVMHGVPAQPGNMTLVAYLDDIVMLGVPSAAIKRGTTVFDVLLPQIFAGQRFTRQELVSLGDGGACQFCETCHFPNCTFGRY